MAVTLKSSRAFARTILVLFGITGDLAQKKIIPSLYRLEEQRLLPPDFLLVGFARRNFEGKKVKQLVRSALARAQIKLGRQVLGRLLKKVFFVRGDVSEEPSFRSLARRVSALEQQGGHCANRLFYFATLPSLYLKISQQLKTLGLLVGCTEHKRETRVMIEKPFGHDLESARVLDRALSRYFSESQIYRMDHYLGKETVQNLMITRFANSIFEPVWNSRYIDHVQISGVVEKAGVEGRGTYYEQTGALRDVVQNHLLQLVALTAMEQPVNFSAAEVRAERAKVLRSIKVWKGKEVSKNIVRGQYGAGRIDGKKIASFRQEEGVASKSQVETFVAGRLFINNERWAGVPFYIRTGKRLGYSATEISLHFKPAPQYLFSAEKTQPNVLTFRIQPNESIYLHLMAKYPGFGMRLHPVDMELGYHQAFAHPIPQAYERLLLDFFQGDQRLFASSEEVEAAWKFTTAILDAWQTTPPPKFPNYKAGSMGPRLAEELIRRDGREWWSLQHKFHK